MKLQQISLSDLIGCSVVPWFASLYLWKLAPSHPLEVAEDDVFVAPWANRLYTIQGQSTGMHSSLLLYVYIYIDRYIYIYNIHK